MCTVIALLDPEHCIISALSTRNKVHLQLSGNSRNEGKLLYFTFCCHSEETLKTYMTFERMSIKNVLFVFSTKWLHTNSSRSQRTHQQSLKGKGYMFFKLFSIFWGDFFVFISHYYFSFPYFSL